MNPSSFFSFFLLLIAVTCEFIGFILPKILTLSYGIGQIDFGLFYLCNDNKFESYDNSSK
jgi:hypothetical protein